MARARVWLGAEMRRHWRRQLAIALTVGLAAAVVLTVVAGSRRTASAYARFDRSHAVPTVELDAPPGMTTEQLHALGRGRDVEVAGGHVPLFAAPDRPNLLPGQDFIVFAATDDAYGRSIDRPLLVEGRLPDPARIDEVFASVDTARELDLHIGSTVRLVSLPAAQTDALLNGDFGKLTLTGPKPAVRVVGIGRTRLDLASVSYAGKYFFATPAFATAYRDKMISFSAGLLDVRLRSGRAGADAFIAHLPNDVTSNSDFSAQALPTSPARDTARVQALALALVGLAAGIAWLIFTLALVGRAAASMSEDHDVLAALGSRRRDRAVDVAVRFVPATVGAVAVAIGGAWLASARFPSGPAGNLDVHFGRAFDATVIVTGAVVVATIILLAAAARGFGGRRATAGRVRTKPPVVARISAASSPAFGTGLRWAIPSAGESRRPARAALVGAVVALAAVVAGVTYSGAVEHLVSSPAAYGWAFDAQYGGEHARDQALHDPAIGDVAIAHIVGTLTLDGVDMQGYAFSTVRGPTHFTVLDGRQPAAPDEVLLGSDSADTLHAGIGDEVHGHDHRGSEVALRVVGLGAFPTIETDSYRTGALLTPETLRRVRKSDGYDAVVFRFAPGIDHNAAARRMRDAGTLEQLALPPGGVNDLRAVRTYPLWLVSFVALLGFVAVANALIVTPVRRRREIGELRALGMTRGQIRSASAVHGVVIATVGIVVGIPLGLLVARVAWTVHARSLGVVGSQIVPALAATAIAGGTLAAITLLAMAAGRRMRVAQPALCLRAE